MSTRRRSPIPFWYFVAGSLTALALFLLGAASYWLYIRQSGETIDTGPPATAGASEHLYDEAWQIVESDFFGPLPSPTDRTYGAIRGSLETLNDPYTYFVEPEPAVREQEQLQGHFGGIGAYLALHEDGRIRLSPMIERPAQLAGVEEGDILLAIDGEPLPHPAVIDDATAQLRGPVGSEVTITVEREERVFDLTITRAQIELPSVTWRALADTPGSGYIRIERFSALTNKELAAALHALRDVGAGERLLLDLRGNPGGLLDAAVDVSSHFLDGGPVLEERHADGQERMYNASAGGEALDVPLLVLVDEGTASAAEIVAGALSDRGRARLVGRTTYGKGSIQRVHRLSDDSALHITFARWYTPDGRQIDDHGLTPDVSVAADATGDDPIFQAALDLLLTTPIVAQ